MTKDPKRQIVQRVTRNFLDILILRLIQIEPMWGYKILKKTQRLFGITIRHGALYPLLNKLEKDGYVRSQKIGNRGRIRKVYDITTKGTQLVDAYYNFLKEQLEKIDIEDA
ncbi:PadR family transcriptional regulator [Thermoproteota archaeon]